MKAQRVAGGGGVQLHVVETGNPEGRPIVFIHGASQCWLQWSRQMNSSLADEHRLVALDMRGHGLSDKPRDGYNDSKLWADDINKVIDALNLDLPVLGGWSYGPLVFLDYIRHYGESRLGGLHFVGAVTKLGSEEAMSVLTPEFLNCRTAIPLHRRRNECARSGELAAGVFRPGALGLRPVPHVGIQCVRPAVRSSGAVLALLPQRRPPAENPQACADYAWRRGCDCQTGRRQSTQGSDASRASAVDDEYGTHRVLGRCSRLQ